MYTVCDHRISSNGGATSAYQGGLSGGSVWVTTTTLKGLGAIEATATKGRTDSASPAAGGRVALYVTDMTQFQGHVRATTTGGQSGYDGTVYVQLPGVLGRSVMDLVVPPNINIEEYVVEGGRWGA